MLTGDDVAVVVPTLTGDVGRLLAALSTQTLQPVEIEVVSGVRPSGRARNLGVARTTAEVIVFLDDDALPVDDACLARLVEPLASDATIGVVGAAKLIPPGSTRFQRRVAREVPRIEHPVATELVETNPPIGRHGYSDVTTTCCAVRRTVLAEVGGFDDDLFRGVDTELFYRVRTAGYRLCLAAGAAVHHPAPPTLRALVVKHFHYGIGYAQEVQLHPERAAGRYLHTPAHAAGYVALRTAALVPHAFVPWTWSARSWRPGFRPLKALSSYAAALGFVYGWYRRPHPTALGREPAGGRRYDDGAIREGHLCGRRDTCAGSRSRRRW